MVRRAEDRGAEELRPISIEGAVQRHPLGSVLIRMGETQVLCAATVEDSVPPFLKGTGQGWVTAEYGMLPTSTQTRTPREGGRARAVEIQRLIGRSLRAVTQLETLGERTIRVDCDVLQADGGTRTASITGGFLALAQALHRMKEEGVIVRVPLKDQVAAVSVGLVQGEILLDLDYREDAMADVDMNVVMTGSGDFVEIQGTAEEGAFTRQELDELLDLAWKGIRRIHEIQLEFLKSQGLC